MITEDMKKEFCLLRDLIIEEEYKHLDKSQIKAVLSNNKNLLICACPGAGKTQVIINRVDYLIRYGNIYNSDYVPEGLKQDDLQLMRDYISNDTAGKTTVIINRVDHLISDLKVKPYNIIVITFTRAAADNMRNRYKNVFNKEEAPFFGTFHGLFYKILLKEGFEISIINSAISYNLIKGVLSKYSDEVSDDKIKEVLNNISTFKTSLKSSEDFKPSLSRDIFNEALEKYEDYKEKNRLWDFDDLSLEVIKLLRDESVANRYSNLFKYILVDEFQDCDELQIEFLKLLNDKSSLFSVGDEDQCIYSFRGSRPEYMVTFNEIFNGGKKIYLSINYRSSENIVEASKDIIKNNIGRNNKIIKAYKNNKGIIKYSTPFDERHQGEEISSVIKASIYDFEDNAILYRTNMEARSIIDAFTRNKIPFILLDKGYNFFDHFICKDLLAYLKLALNSKDKENFLHIINKPFRYVSKANLDYVRNYKEDKCPFEIIIDKKDTPPYQAKKLDDLRKDILHLNKLSLSSAIQFIISELGYIDYLKSYCERYNQSFNDYEDILEEFKSAAEGIKTIFELLQHVEGIKEKIEESKNEKEGVILSTIHGVKGMEFKNVFLINCTEETIPHKSSIDENLEEERRLFYVGITRAIDNLYISSPKTQRGRFKEISRFVKEGSFNEINDSEDCGVEIGDTIAHKVYGEGVVNEISKDTIKIDFISDITRSFSLKVLLSNNIITIIK